MKEMEPSKTRQLTNNLKRKLKSSQTLLSNTRQRCNKIRIEKEKQDQKIQQMEKDFLRIDNEYSNGNLKMREENSNKFTTDVIKCVVELIGEAEVSGKNCGKVIDVVSRNLFHVKLDPRDIPSERSSLRFADKGHVLAKCQLGEELLNSSCADLHSDGTSKDHTKVVGHQLSTDGGKMLSCGFTPVCREDADTLVDVAFNLLKELAELYSADEADMQFRSMVRNLTGLMSDRASVMKSFNHKFNTKRKELLEMEEDMEFLHCNAHFLLGLSSACEKVIKTYQKDKGKDFQFGRDKEPKFLRFHSAENPASRYIRLACDILGPRGDEKSGCKDSWDAFCSMQDVKSEVTSFRGNRFNNLFQAAASLHHHRDGIINFLKNYMPGLNLKQESVLYDAECNSVDVLIIALGIMYHKVTGPYWILMGMDIQYLNFYLHVTAMHEALSTWELDASPMLDENSTSLFNVEVTSIVLASLYNVTEEKKDEVALILKKLCAEFKSVVERQLTDFLSGGRYHNVQDEVQIQRLKHSKITNLVGEECFGDLDFSIFKRRNASLHHHSTVNMLKRNKTSSWFEAKSVAQQKKLLWLCTLKSQTMREEHQDIQKNVLETRKQMLADNKRQKEIKAAKLAERKHELVEKVKRHGGPCLEKKDVDTILENLGSQRQQIDAIKDEIRYHKTVLGAKSKTLTLAGSLSNLTTKLKSFLGNEPFLEGESNEAITGVEHSNTETEDDENELYSDLESESDVEDASVIDDTNFGSFEFSRQGEFVAVFYDNEYYVGQVLSFENKTEGKVSFLDKCRIKKNTFRWTDSNTVEDVSAVYVFDWGFDMIPNGRFWQLIDADVFNKLERKYQLYKELYC